MVASIGCSFSGTVLLLQNHYPRFRGAPSGHFRMLTKRPPSVDSGLAMPHGRNTLRLGAKDDVSGRLDKGVLRLRCRHELDGQSTRKRYSPPASWCSNAVLDTGPAQSNATGALRIEMTVARRDYTCTVAPKASRPFLTAPRILVSSCSRFRKVCTA